MRPQTNFTVIIQLHDPSCSNNSLGELQSWLVRKLKIIYKQAITQPTHVMLCDLNRLAQSSKAWHIKFNHGNA